MNRVGRENEADDLYILSVWPEHDRSTASRMSRYCSCRIEYPNPGFRQGAPAYLIHCSQPQRRPCTAFESVLCRAEMDLFSYLRSRCARAVGAAVNLRRYAPGVTPAMRLKRRRNEAGSS